MGVITLDNIGNPKHRNFIKYVSDVFDEHRGNIPDDLAFTRFKGMNHTILFNTANPELNGKSLIQFDNDKILFAPVQIQSLICSEPENNSTINILTQPKNNNVWEAKSNDKIIKLLINLRDKSTIAGFSIRFADSVRTKYRMSLTLANENNEIVSQVVNSIESSWETNSQQFFQLATPIDGVTKAVIDLELVGTNDYVWKVNNISLYSNMNLESLKSLSELGVITWSLIQNSVFMKDLDDTTTDLLNKSAQSAPNQEQESQLLSVTSEYTDHFGSPIPYKPITNRQYFDNLSDEELVKMVNVNRIYSITDLPTGDKIYTFETNPNSKNLTIKFSPVKEMNKYTDEPVIQLDKIVKSGEIKQGGFKNYVLTLYLKMDGMTMTDQELVWKYGGYYFNKDRPELARAMNVIIPINNKAGLSPSISTEYYYDIKKSITSGINISEFPDFKGLEEGQWVGLQFIRQVNTENDNALQIVRINRNPFNIDNMSINHNGFEDYLVYYDTMTADHIAHIWSGVQELISVTGSKFVSLYGISMYEVEYNTEVRQEQ